ncbi:MAG: SCO family protein [Chloroflexi bacterium]|nr:SCO family protein [Chloroflexota bacterium]
MNAAESNSNSADGADFVDSDQNHSRSFLESKLWFAVFLIVGIAVAITSWVLFTRAESEIESFAYTEFDPPKNALNFSLVNQRGETFTLSEHAGEATILTFLYTSCTDVCPFVGAKLREVLDILGDEAESLNVVAITMDPVRDTPERVTAYGERLRMDSQWDYLLGDESELVPLWQEYFVGLPTITDQAVFATQDDIDLYELNLGLSDLNERSANAARYEFGGGYDVGHPTPVIIIDKNLKVRIVAGQHLDPVEFAADARKIINES